MNRFQLLTAGAVLLACMSLVACGSSPAGPSDAPAAAASKLQSDFDAACKYGGGVWQMAKPLASVPAIAAKIGDQGQLAIEALDAVINVTCKTPLDVTNAAAVTQRVYDAGGAVFALVIQEISS